MCPEQSTKTVIVAFYRASTWWGWVIAYYQLLRRIRYWQVVHVELFTEEGIYAYRIDRTIVGSPHEEWYEPDYRIYLVDHNSETYRYDIAWNLRRAWGDFTPLSPFNGNHCVRWVNRLLGSMFTINLPGQLLEALELRDVIRVLQRNKANDVN